MTLRDHQNRVRIYRFLNMDDRSENILASNGTIIGPILGFIVTGDTYRDAQFLPPSRLRSHIEPPEARKSACG